MAYSLVAQSAEDELVRRREYAELVERARNLTVAAVPEGSVVAVVSKGDPDLLRIEGRVAQHFPRNSTGAYAGFHPADDADAIARLEAARADGARYLLLPATAFWWLDHYAGFKRHLDSRYERVAEQSDSAILYSLAGVAGSIENAPDSQDDGSIHNVRAIAAALLPAGVRVVVVTGGDDRLRNLGGPIGLPFPVESTSSADEALDHLERLRRAGAAYLLIPRSQDGWVQRFAGLRAYLRRECVCITDQANVCTIYELGARSRQEPLRQARQPGGSRWWEDA